MFNSLETENGRSKRTGRKKLDWLENFWETMREDRKQSEPGRFPL